MKQISPKLAFKIFTIVSVIGALLSLYLLVHHLEHRLGVSSGKSFCSINEYFDCDKVADSIYSELFGIPVAGFGLFFFSFNLFILRVSRTSAEEAKTWSLLKLLSFVGIVPTIVLASISIILIKSICIFCFATYLCAVALGAISFRLNLSKGNFVSEGVGLFVEILRKNQSLILGFLLLGSLSLVAPLVVIDQYRQSVPSLEISNENRALEEWSNGKVYPESQIFISQGADRDLAFGLDSSLVTVVSYSDMACPRCKFIAKELHKLNQKYPFKLIFKDYPLDQHCNPVITRVFHDSSCQAAKIGRCALLTSQELYEQVHEKLYALEEVTSASLEPIAESVGNSSSAASQCLNDPGYPKSITRHLDEGLALKIPGTPAIFINGKFIASATPNILEKIIKLALQAHPKK